MVWDNSDPAQINGLGGLLSGVADLHDYPTSPAVERPWAALGARWSRISVPGRCEDSDGRRALQRVP